MASIIKTQVETSRPTSLELEPAHQTQGTPSPDSCHEVKSDRDVTTPTKIQFQSTEQPDCQVVSPPRPQPQEPDWKQSSSSSGAPELLAFALHGACEEETYSEDEEMEEKPHRYYEFYHNQPGALHLRCKSLENFSDDYKLQVLQWAYSKTVHSAGHHFRLERFIVRNWMMNEEKIVKGASEKEKRRFERYDERVYKHLANTRPVPSRQTESRLIHGLDDMNLQLSP